MAVPKSAVCLGLVFVGYLISRLVCSHSLQDSMACLLPIVPKLRSSFLRPVDSTTPPPARSVNEQEIARAGIRTHHHIVTTECSAPQWLSLRAFIERTEGKDVVYLPRGQELNTD